MIEREDVLKIGERRLLKLIATPPEDAFNYGIRTTSGTTKQAPLVMVAKYNEAYFNRFSEGRRIVTCLGSLNVRLVNLLHARHQIGEGAPRIMLVDARDMVPGLAACVEDFAPDFISGFPSFIERLAEHITPITGRGVKKILLSGERATSLFMAMTGTVFSNVRVHAFYSASEFGLIGTSCPHLPVNHYHPSEGITVEIVDADETGSGDFVVSNHASNDTTTIERYHIGDTGRVYSLQCPCGTTVAFEHLGRKGHDYIRTAGALLRREEFERVMLLFAHTIDDYRVEAQEVSVSGTLLGKITVRVFRRSGPFDPAAAGEIAREISEQLFLTPTRTLSDLVAEGLFIPLVVEFSDTPFRSGHKNVRLARI